MFFFVDVVPFAFNCLLYFAGNREFGAADQRRYTQIKNPSVSFCGTGRPSALMADVTDLTTLTIRAAWRARQHKQVLIQLEDLFRPAQAAQQL